ncbi:PAS domain-containing protein [Hymenobacter arizonensis]|uniref:histidine kinase n=1 Tax=Hymenobacter arizonensis TaxID=1227077 RepID=A0A1I5Y335_HYMAR|nr:PAS domain-containing protein [Hymenobacter arizonensis]SFQ38586.1 PAS domain S-box-containing protein [Hymenobacter arizonensis]
MPTLPLPTPDFELLFAALPAPFAALAPDSTVLALNTAMEQLLGPNAAAQFCGQPLAALRKALETAGHVVAPAPAWATGLRAAQAGATQLLKPDWQPEEPATATAPSAMRHWEATLQPVPAGAAAGELRYLLLSLLNVDEQQRKLRILDQLPLTISTMEGPELTFTFLSARAQKSMGTRVAVGSTVAESLPEIAAQGYLKMLEQVRDSGQPIFGHEERTEVLDPATGTLRERFNNFGYLPLRNGQRAGVLAYSLDVTEQVQARRHNEALVAEARAADQRMRRVTESLPSITFISNQEGDILYISPQWYAYTGVGPADDITRAWQEQLHPDDLARVQPAYAAALANGTSWSYEIRLRRHDGEFRWFMSQGVPEPLEDAQAAGRPRQWFGSDLDIHELHETQRQLEAKDQQLSQILSQSPAMIATVAGPDHRFTFVNDAYDELMGHRARVGEPAAKCLPEVAEQGFVKLLESVYQSGKPFVGRAIPLDVQDGTAEERRRLYLDFTYQLLRNDQGEASGILAFGVDVTQQVLARQETEVLQAAVRDADLRLRRQAEVLPIITFSTDAQGRTTYMSPQWYHFTGQKPGGPWHEVDTEWTSRVHPDDQEKSRYEIQESIDFTRLGRVEVRLRGANGQYRWFLTEAVPELNAAGQLRQRYGYMLDVHELRETQQRLEEKDRQLSRILDQAPAMIATLEGPDHRFTFFNPNYSRLLGQGIRLGQPMVEALPDLAAQGFVDLLDQVYQTGEPFVGEEVMARIANPDTGQMQERYFDFTYIAQPDAQGATQGILSFAVDVTERVQARNRAAAAQAVAQAADKRLRLLAESLPLITYQAAANGTTEYISPQWFAYTGQNPASFDATSSWGEAIHPDDRAMVGESFTANTASGKSWQYEFRLRRHDGQYRRHLSRSTPELDPATGEVLRWYGTTLDIQDLHERTEELARSRADFAALANNISQLAWMADASGYIFWYNQQWYDYTNTTFETMQGWGWKAVHDPALVEDITERFRASIASGEPWEDTFPLRRHDGEYRWFLSRARPIRDAETGAVVRWFGTNTDVTELRQLQTRLEASEEELRIQAESIPQQVWTAQPDGTVDFYNHRTAAYVGAAMEKNGAAHWLTFVHPDDHAPMQARWEQAIASQRYYEAEFRLRRYDGEYRWFLGQAQARRAPGGQVLKWYGTNTDVHQQRVLQEQLLASQARFQQLLEALPQMAWTAHPDGRVDYYNRRWYDFTGGTFEQLQDWGWERFVHPDDLSGTLQGWQESLATGEPYEREHRWRDQIGNYRWFLTRAEALRDKAGDIAVWVGANTDVHEFKQVQEQLQAQNARLVRTNDDLDNFVYTASHDLKQPINNMAGIFEELTRTAYFRDPDAIKLITYFERALAQIFSTIDDLSAIVRGQRQQQEIPAEEVLLAPLVDEVIGSLQDQVTQSGAVFELDFATCPVVTFVRPNMQSLLFNLLSNSLKYAAPDRPPRIHISCMPDVVSGRPILRVQDNGIGIDMERFGPQLFQLFRRFHTHVDGTGMGLYLVNRIVQNHGGHLEVNSVVGEGTTFQIYL